MKKTAVVIDSGSSYSQVQAQENGFHFLPLHIIFSENEDYLEGENISSAKVYERMLKGDCPKTSQPSIGEFEACYTNLQAQGYDSIIIITLGSGLSGTYENAIMASQMVEIEVLVIDSKSAVLVQIYLAKKALEFAEQGFSLKDIEKRLKPIVDNSFIYIIPEDLQYLKRGGRLTAAAALLGGLLKLKPILKINTELDGKVDVVTKVRTMTKAVDKMFELTETIVSQGSDYHFAVAHAGTPDKAQELKNRIQLQYGDVEVEIIELSAVLGAHAGPGLLAIMGVKKLQ